MTDAGKMRREMNRQSVVRRPELVADDGAPNDDGAEMAAAAAAAAAGVGGKAGSWDRKVS